MSAVRRTVGILAVTQIASWGALYYAFAVLAPDIRRDVHISAGTAFAAYSLLYGMSNGVLAIVHGTLPRAMFGARHYGAVTGAMAAPALLANASRPLLLPLVLFDCGLASLPLYLSAVRFTPAPGASVDKAEERKVA